MNKEEFKKIYPDIKDENCSPEDFDRTIKINDPYNLIPKSEFTCFRCKITYQIRNDEEWNDQKAIEEMLKLYPETKNDPVDVLCDDCNEEFKKWFSTLTEEQKIKMREEYNR